MGQPQCQGRQLTSLSNKTIKLSPHERLQARSHAHNNLMFNYYWTKLLNKSTIWLVCGLQRRCKGHNCLNFLSHDNQFINCILLLMEIVALGLCSVNNFQRDVLSTTMYCVHEFMLKKEVMSETMSADWESWRIPIPWRSCMFGVFATLSKCISKEQSYNKFRSEIIHITQKTLVMFLSLLSSSSLIASTPTTTTTTTATTTTIIIITITIIIDHHHHHYHHHQIKFWWIRFLRNKSYILRTCILLVIWN